MNTNITWSTYYNGWNTLEYNTSTANQTLNTQLNPSYANPITISPADIQTDALSQKIGTLNPFNTSLWGTAGTGAAPGAIIAITNTTHSITLSENESGAGAYSEYFHLNIPTTDLPSNNPSYDYFTISGTASQPDTGMYAEIQLGSTGNFTPIIGTKNGNADFSAINTNGALISGNSMPTGQYWASVSLANANLTVPTTSASIGIVTQIPQSANDHTLTVTITGLGLSTTPQTLGTTTYNRQPTTLNYFTKVANLTTLDPTFPWTSITSGGYTVATSQPLQNLTTQQSSINDGSYTEQVTYQGYEQLPTAPDLSYSTTNISIPMNIPGSQFVVANINGVSYLSTINIKDNGTFSFGTVNPNNPNSIVLEIKYTAAQWSGISGPPVWYSIAGVEYYWYVFLGVLLGAIGLGAGVNSRASTFRQVKK
jgi:hypothetical protein